MSKKYKLLKDSFMIAPSYEKIYRIKALKDFGDVKKGDIGGLISSENNLSQEGKCWVYDDARVYGNAKILGNAQIRKNVKVSDYAIISGNAVIDNNAEIHNQVIIIDNVCINDYAYIGGNARIFDNVHVYGNARIMENANLSEDVVVFDNAHICGNAIIKNSVTIEDEAIIGGDSYINEKDIIITSDALIRSQNDYIIFRNFLGNNIFVYNCDSGIIITHNGTKIYSIKEYRKYISKNFDGKEKIMMLMLVNIIKYHFKEKKIRK